MPVRGEPATGAGEGRRPSLRQEARLKGKRQGSSPLLSYWARGPLTRWSRTSPDTQEVGVRCAGKEHARATQGTQSRLLLNQPPPQGLAVAQNHPTCDAPRGAAGPWESTAWDRATPTQRSTCVRTSGIPSRGWSPSPRPPPLLL